MKKQVTCIVATIIFSALMPIQVVASESLEHIARFLSSIF